MTGIAHVFYDVYLGWSHKSLSALLTQKTGKDELPKGEVAVFLNKSWTATKILAPGNVLLYYRSPNGAPITKEQIRILPTLLGAPRFNYTGKHEVAVLRAFESRFGKSLQRMKGVGGA